MLPALAWFRPSSGTFTMRKHLHRYICAILAMMETYNAIIHTDTGSMRSEVQHTFHSSPRNRDVGLAHTSMYVSKLNTTLTLKPCWEIPRADDDLYSKPSLKRKCRHFDEIFITGCTGSCHFDNFQCSQWWKFHQNEDISVSVFQTEHLVIHTSFRTIMDLRIFKVNHVIILPLPTKMSLNWYPFHFDLGGFGIIISYHWRVLF